MKKRTRETTLLDMTPLIDVVFLLLIFFMVSSVFKKEDLALLLELPKTSEGKGKKSKKENLSLELNENYLAMNGKKVKLDNFSALVKDIENKKIPINLRVDQKVQYNRLVKVLEVLQKHSLSNLSLITEKK